MKHWLKRHPLTADTMPFVIISIICSCFAIGLGVGLVAEASDMDHAWGGVAGFGWAAVCGIALALWQSITS